MSSVLIFGGTTEGRQLAELLSQSKISCTVCVATEYGEQVLEESPLLHVHQGRMNAAQMHDLITQGQFQAVVDATHPFARVVTQTIQESMQGIKIPYIRLKRDMSELKMQEHIRWFADTESCAAALQELEGNILLTTGSKEIHKFAVGNLKERLYIRVLPSIESIMLCEQSGFFGKQIIALQGPFSTAMNEAMIDQYQISLLVTKETGAAGGFPEKLEASCNRKIQCMVIGNPEAAAPGCSFQETVDQLFAILNKPAMKPTCTIHLIGMGMGDPDGLTSEAKQALHKATVVFGAKRLLAELPSQQQKYPYYLAEEIITVIHQLAAQKETLHTTAAILLSGDCGFYSGAKQLVQKLQEGISLPVDLHVLPGISSISYLAAKLQISWHDAKIVSIHGRQANVAGLVRHHPKTFVLLSGVKELQTLGEQLTLLGMGEAKIGYGYQLSYPDELIQIIAAKDCGMLSQEGLYCCFIFNEKAQVQPLTASLPDSTFIRGNVPMTKEEVREVSIAKLRLQQDSIVYDIGSGTGSVAIACALLSDQMQVYAIERNPEALDLIKQNISQQGVSNITVVAANAPEGLEQLPPPTHVFIGGSGGRLKDMIDLLVSYQQPIRVVLNAITLETISAGQELLNNPAIQNMEMVQLQVSRARKLGGYHLMQAENPVTIISFDLGNEAIV